MIHAWCRRRAFAVFATVLASCASQIDGVDDNETQLADRCEVARASYYASIEAARACDPTAATPCAAYTKVVCAPTGVAPELIDDLEAAYSDYETEGCTLPVHSCPIGVSRPSPYTCQADTSGAYKCLSACEAFASGRATCVSEASGCPGARLDGYCGQAMLCCF